MASKRRRQALLREGRLPLSALTLWPRNYNQGDVGAIYTSIRLFGFNGALRVWKDGMVCAGNHQLLALRAYQKEGAPTAPPLDPWPPVHIEVDEDGEWWPRTISVAHLTKIQAEAFAVADNHTRDLAAPNEELLFQVLRDVHEQDARLLLATGYDAEQLDAMRRALNPEPADTQEHGKHAGPLVACPECGHEFAVDSNTRLSGAA